MTQNADSGRVIQQRVGDLRRQAAEHKRKLHAINAEINELLETYERLYWQKSRSEA